MARCRRNPRVDNGLGRSAAPRGVARRSRTRRRVRHAPRAWRGWQLGPAQPRGFMKPVLIIAHRGASAHAPENTKAAILKALTMKVDGIELDVQLTRDERLVIFHDERLERTTTGHGVLSHQRYQDLTRLDSGSWFAPRFTGERILLASQALRLITPLCLANLELKPTPRAKALIRQMVRCLRWTRSLNRVLVSSFDPSLLASLKAAQPRIAVALLCRQNPKQAFRHARALGCVAIHPHTSLMNPAFIAQAHAADMRVHVWTVDRADEATQLLGMNVDGLFTNTPDRIRQAVGV